MAGLFQKQYVQNLAVKLRAVVPTLRKRREGWGTRFLGDRESRAKRWATRLRIYTIGADEIISTILGRFVAGWTVSALA